MNIWLAIINPAAGSYTSLRRWEKVKKSLQQLQIPFVPFVVEEEGTTIQKVKEAIQKGFRHLMAVGGDGTLHEVVNAIYESGYPPEEFLVTMIPSGTGNDWARNYGLLHKNPQKLAQIIKNRKTVRQDIGIAEYHEGEKKKKRYFVNHAGIGYDALVVKKANRQKKHRLGNRFSYFFNILFLLNAFRGCSIRFSIDDEEFSSSMYTMNVGICRYIGGGMMMLPYAIPDDGLLEVTMIRKLNVWRIITNLFKIYNGNIVKVPETVITQGEKIDIHTDPVVWLEADGEMLGHSPFSFRILPKSLLMVIP